MDLGYIKLNFSNDPANTRVFLKFNESRLYELRDKATDAELDGYICEAQG